LLFQGVWSPDIPLIQLTFPLMTAKLQILAVTPPPSPGAPGTPAIQNFLEGHYESIALQNLPMPSHRGGLGGMLSLIRLISRVKAEVKRTNPRVLYFPLPDPASPSFLAGAVLLAATRKRFPRTVLHLHTLGLAERLARLSGPLKALVRRGYGKPDLAIVSGKDGRGEAELLHAARTEVVPPGVPDVWEDGPRSRHNSPPTVLFLGTVCEEKGVGVLIEACKILHDRGHKFLCKIAGPAVSETVLAGLRQQAAEAGPVINFLGPISGDAKWELFAESDVFCAPSRSASESFSLATVEAMMSGLPVVATHWRALPEIVADGKTGFLATVNDPRATADKLAKLLRDPILRQVMGNSARNRFLDHYRVDTFRYAMESALAAAGA
jgi:glycosyltransferase involved in cell wall biosynthesis